jgi:hypothetical protein
MGTIYDLKAARESRAARRNPVTLTDTVICVDGTLLEITTSERVEFEPLNRRKASSSRLRRVALEG